MKIPARRKAVAPVIATLLMIAVAVAMSVIIFMWSQGFLSNTSNSVGGQQGSMNQGASSAVGIDSATATSGSTSITVVVRNVGGVTETLGALIISPGASNTGLKTAGTITFSGASCTLAKGAAAVIKIPDTTAGPPVPTVTGATCTIVAAPSVTWGTAASGDVINFKATTSVGTFGVTSITVA